MWTWTFHIDLIITLDSDLFDMVYINVRSMMNNILMSLIICPAGGISPERTVLIEIDPQYVVMCNIFFD